MPTDRVCALLPAYNEETVIESTINALLSNAAINAIYVVDDGSTDKTLDKARAFGETIHVVHQANAGKGAALSRAYAEARESGDIFLLLDSDLGASAAESIKLLLPIFSGDADMVVGMLPPDPAFAASKKSGGMGFVVRLARWGIRRAVGLETIQPLSGQRAVRGGVIEAFGGVFASGFGVEVALTISAVRNGFRVLEVPAHFRHKVTASDMPGILHRARQFVDVAKAVAISLPRARTLSS